MKPYTFHAWCMAGSLAAASLLGGCHGKENGGQQTAQPGAPVLDSEKRIAQIPLGDKATGPDKDVMPVTNPYAGSAQAIEQGRQLYVKMNCAGCHTYTGKGWMGPDLTDNYWRYGGSDDEIYKSLYEGRPQGMPAWGKALPPDDLWRLVSYIRSLSSGKNAAASTEPRKGTGVAPATASDQTVDVLPPGAGSASNNPVPSATGANK